jgi:hypothetical protein
VPAMKNDSLRASAGATAREAVISLVGWDEMV